MGSNFGAERSPLLVIGIGFAIGAITIGAGGGTGAGVGADVVAVAGSGADVFAGSDGELSGGGGDGDRELGVITDGDGDKWDVVGKFQSEIFECLASLSGTGNKSKSEKSPSSAKAANISSRRFRCRFGRSSGG